MPKRLTPLPSYKVGDRVVVFNHSTFWDGKIITITGSDKYGVIGTCNHPDIRNNVGYGFSYDQVRYE